MKIHQMRHLGILTLALTSVTFAQSDLFEQLPLNKPKHGEVIGLEKNEPGADWKTDQDKAPRWFQVPGTGVNGIQVFENSGFQFSVPLPPITDATGQQAVVFVEIVGSARKAGSARAKLSFIDPGGALIASKDAVFNLTQVGTYPMRQAKILHVPKGDGILAIDGDPRSYWGTGYKKSKNPAAPFHLDIDLGQSRKFSGFTLIPGMPHYTEGMPLDWGFYTSADGKNWDLVKEGRFNYSPDEKKSGGPRKTQEVKFDTALSAKFVRFETRSLLAESQVNIREFDLIWDPSELPAPAPKAQRITLGLPHQAMIQHAGKPLQVRLETEGHPDLVLSDINFESHPKLPTRKDEAKPNGKNGPDRIGMGMLGFDALTSHQLAYLPIMRIHPDSPAAAAGLEAGDLIIGVNGSPLAISSCASGWDWFYAGHEAVLGRACQTALQTPDSAKLKLTFIRSGKEASATLDLGLWGFDSAPDGRFPLAGPLSEQFQTDLIQWIRDNQKPNGTWGKDIQDCFAVLGLLGTRDPQHAEAITKAIDYTLENRPPIKGGLSFWGLSFTGIMMCEYHLATGDPRVLPWIERCVTWMPTVSNTSKWDMPTFGHGPGGLPYGQKALMAPLTHMLVFEALAERCGIDVVNQRGEPEGIWEIALPYCKYSWSDPDKGGHGAMGYNASYKDLAEFWSRSGLFSLAAVLRDTEPEMSSAMAKIMGERHAWMRGSHAYGAPGNVLGLLGLAMTDRETYLEVMQSWSWSFLGAWQPGKKVHWSMPHMGAPYMGEDALIHPMYLTLLATQSASLHITGATDRYWLTLPENIRSQQLIIQRRSDDSITITSNGSPDEIRFTTDGSPPTAQSKLYQGPFRLDSGGFVRATTILDNKAGPEAKALLQAMQSKPIILEATGSQDSKLAIRHAESLVDGDTQTAWLTDVGQLATPYPHRVKIDYLRDIKIDEIHIHNGESKSSPTQLAIRFSKDGKSWTTGQVFKIANQDELQSLKLKQKVTARYLELIATQPADEGAKNVSLNELSILPSKPQLVRTSDGKAKLILPAGTSARFTTDASPPNKNSPLYRAPFEITSGQIIAIDLYKGTTPISRSWLEIK